MGADFRTGSSALIEGNMRLFAAALLARKSAGAFELLETIPVIVSANSEIEAGREAKREARKIYPKNKGWQITGRVIEIDQTQLLEKIITKEDEINNLATTRNSGRIH